VSRERLGGPSPSPLSRRPCISGSGGNRAPFPLHTAIFVYRWLLHLDFAGSSALFRVRRSLHLSGLSRVGPPLRLLDFSGEVLVEGLEAFTADSGF
jgi:hypothetical protein